MDIESTANKLLAPIEKHASLVGAGIALIDPFVWQSVLGDITSMVQGKGHMPEWGNWVSSLAINEHVKTGIIAAIAGYVLDGATGIPAVNRLAEIAKKAGVSYAVVYAIRDLLYFSTHSDAQGATSNYPQTFSGNNSYYSKGVQ